MHPKTIFLLLWTVTKQNKTKQKKTTIILKFKAKYCYSGVSWELAVSARI